MAKQKKKKQNSNIPLIAFTCNNCGASFSCMSGESLIVCESCGFEQEINSEISKEDEKDYLKFLETKEAHAPKLQLNKQECRSCGASIFFANDQVSEKCAFCGVSYGIKGGSTTAGLKPDMIVPFKLKQGEMEELFRKWIRWRIWSPSDLKKQASHDPFQAVYLPFWKFGAETVSEYSGEYSYGTDNLKWVAKSGTLEYSFEDLLIPDSREDLNPFLAKAAKECIDDAVPFNDIYMTDFRVYMFKKGLQKSFREAKDKMHEDLDYFVKRHMGGSNHRGMKRQTRFSNISFSYVLMPFFISTMKYKDENYTFVINGHNGKVKGDSPTSKIKISIASVLGMISFFAIIALFDKYPWILIVLIPFLILLIFWLRKRGEKI